MLGRLSLQVLDLCAKLSSYWFKSKSDTIVEKSVDSNQYCSHKRPNLDNVIRSQIYRGKAEIFVNIFKHLKIKMIQHQVGLSNVIVYLLRLLPVFILFSRCQLLNKNLREKNVSFFKLWCITLMNTIMY